MSRWGKRKGAVLIKGLLPSLANDQGWQRKLAQCAVFDHWQKIVPEEVADHCQPLKVSNGVLWIEVENSAWIQQFQYQKLFLLESINEFLGNNGIDDIRFVIGEKRKEKEELKPVRFVAPPKEKIEAFENQVGIIKDEKSREALMRFWYLCNACKRD